MSGDPAAASQASSSQRLSEALGSEGSGSGSSSEASEAWDQTDGEEGSPRDGEQDEGGVHSGGAQASSGDAGGARWATAADRRPSTQEAEPRAEWRRAAEALRKAPALREAGELRDIGAHLRAVAREPLVQRLAEAPVCARLVLEEFGAGARIYDAGAATDRLYVVCWGSVVTDGATSRGDGARLGRGAAFGGALATAMAAVLPGAREAAAAVPAGATAAEACALAVISRDALLESLQEPAIEESPGEAEADGIAERVSFLRTLDRANFGGVDASDLEAFARLLRVEAYHGGSAILRQGAEVDRVVFVKSGFCNAIRELHPRHHDAYGHFVDKHRPPPNPFAHDDPPQIAAAASTAPATGFPLQLGLRAALSRMMPADRPDSSSSPDPAPRAMARTAVGARSFRKMRSAITGDLAEEDTAQLTGRPGGAAVVVDHLQAGRSFGTAELFDSEGTPYLYSLVADPWATVYVVSRYDLLRSTPKSILHRLFIDFKMRLPDDRLVQRMRQKQRWNSYKRDLLDDIQQRRNRSKFSAIDRRAPPPRRAGVGDLSVEDYMRIGAGEGVWHGRATTPPVPPYSGKDTFDLLHLQCTRRDDGRKDLALSREHRDASLVALDDRLVMMTQTARRRDRLARRGGARQQRTRSPLAAGDDREATSPSPRPSSDRAARRPPRLTGAAPVRRGAAKATPRTPPGTAAGAGRRAVGGATPREVRLPAIRA